MRKSITYPVVWVAALWTVAFTLACFLSLGISAPTSSLTVWRQLLGGSRTELGEQLYLKADIAFHKGIRRHHPRAFRDWFAGLREALEPREHVHLQGRELKEIMPWIYFATRIDPGNVTAYVVGAYWLAGQLERPELAIDLLREAHVNNPGDYRIYQEQGRLWMRSGEWLKATRALDAGMRVWPHPMSADDLQVQMNLAQMQSYRAIMAELSGDTKLALILYHQILEAFPTREGLRRRYDAIRAGMSPIPAAGDLLKNILAYNRHVCGHAGLDDNTPHDRMECEEHHHGQSHAAEQY